jgi:hypothetical protein
LSNKQIVNVGIPNGSCATLHTTLYLVEHLEMQQILGLRRSLNFISRRNRALTQDAVLTMANLLVEIVVTLDKWPALFYRVLPAKVSDQTLQHRRILCCVGVAYSILKSLEKSRVVLVVFCHRRLFRGWIVFTVIFTQGKFYVYRVVALRPAGPEPSILTSILSRFSEEGDIRDVGS